MTIQDIIQKNRLPHKMMVRFAIAVARDSLQYTDDKKVTECLDVVEGFMKGRKTREELISARDTAYAAACTAYAAAYTAANAADAAARAAYYGGNKAWNKVKESKENEYKELLLRMIRDMSELERLLLNVKVS